MVFEVPVVRGDGPPQATCPIPEIPVSRFDLTLDGKKEVSVYPSANVTTVEKGGKTMAICNVIGSMLTRDADGTLMTHAGPEIGVASTKAFTSQLTALFLLSVGLSISP